MPFYITATRETQLARVMGRTIGDYQGGRPCRVPKLLNRGKPGAGLAVVSGYSAVAPHNATGNFTKIVQRLPVRICIDP